LHTFFNAFSQVPSLNFAISSIKVCAWNSLVSNEKTAFPVARALIATPLVNRSSLNVPFKKTNRICLTYPPTCSKGMWQQFHINSGRQYWHGFFRNVQLLKKNDLKFFPTASLSDLTSNTHFVKRDEGGNEWTP
jgi:hypothetical protein